MIQRLLGPTSLLVVLAASNAQAGSPPERPASALETANKVEAERLFRHGVAAYDAKAFQEAIGAFKAAYERSKLPALLFDLAQAQRAAGNCAPALATLDEFVATTAPDDPLLLRARVVRDELRDGCPGPRATPSAALPPPGPRPTPPALELSTVSVQALATPRLELVAPVATAPRGPGRHRCALSLAGTLVLATASTATSLWARGLAHSVEQAPTWTDDVRSDDTLGRRLGTTATIGFIATGVAAVVMATACWPAVR